MRNIIQNHATFIQKRAAFALSAGLVLGSLLVPPGVQAGAGKAPVKSVKDKSQARVLVPYPDVSKGIVHRRRGMVATSKGDRGMVTTSKLTPDLERLYQQLFGGRGAQVGPRYSLAQIGSRYGIAGRDRDPAIGLAITLKPGADPEALRAAGATVYFRAGETVYASAPVSALAALVKSNAVAAVAPTKAATYPTVPRAARFALTDIGRGAEALPIAFDHQGMTGKGVVVGIVDSGIAWQHQDFRKVNGKTRILALWDMTDDSWTTSGGTVGSKPPVEVKDKPLGTLYTQAQINAALTGTGTVASKDLVGHGTACASTAAGSGRATDASVPAGQYAGVAPESDLVIVRAGAGEGITGLYFLGTRWIAETAKAHGEPCVISQSFGNQDNPHDGSSEDEAVMNDVAGAGKPGVVICAAAGNEGKDSFHAGGRFGPRQEGQADVQSEQIELFVSKDTELDAYFSDADEWGLAVVGLDTFLVDADGKPDAMLISHADGHIKGILKATAKVPSNFQTYFDSVGVAQTPNHGEDRLSIPLPAGKYLILGFGATAKVTTGAFDLYLPFTGDASFGHGTDKRYMVASPGNADNVLTVGAYNFRSGWTNADGKETAYNLVLGDLSDYSSPGFRRGGAIKPDISAPATYTISALAPGSEMSKDNAHAPDTVHITHDGFHLAWAGTSAATPYVAGVVALMLQKNPGLDAAQVKDILAKTAVHDDFTGAVPNIHWGYGKIAPAAALAATPVPK